MCEFRILAIRHDAGSASPLLSCVKFPAELRKPCGEFFTGNTRRIRSASARQGEGIFRTGVSERADVCEGSSCNFVRRSGRASACRRYDRPVANEAESECGLRMLADGSIVKFRQPGPIRFAASASSGCRTFATLRVGIVPASQLAVSCGARQGRRDARMRRVRTLQVGSFLGHLRFRKADARRGAGAANSASGYSRASLREQPVEWTEGMPISTRRDGVSGRAGRRRRHRRAHARSCWGIRAVCMKAPGVRSAQRLPHPCRLRPPLHVGLR